MTDRLWPNCLAGGAQRADHASRAPGADVCRRRPAYAGAERRNTMQPGIDALTDEQAVRALRLFYDLTPAEIWEGGRKPSTERMRTVTAALREEAPADIRPVLEALLASDRPGALA